MHEHPPFKPRVKARDLALIAVAAVLLRCALFAIVSIRGHISLSSYAKLYDGRSYLITARAMCGDRSDFNDYHGRVFPGYPALIALVHQTGVPFGAAGVAIDWAAAAMAAVLAAMLFGDRRVGWAMVMLIPHYLMNSALALSEAPLLALTLAGLLMARRGRAAAGGALLGLAGLVRPMACFAAAACVLAGNQERGRRAAFKRAVVPVAAAAVFLLGMLLVHHWRGDALAGARYYAHSSNAYAGELFTWPFHALLFEPIQHHIAAGRVVYMWAHAVLVLTACAVMVRRFQKGSPAAPPRDGPPDAPFRHIFPVDGRDALAAPWLWCNTLFALCIGSIWGFECFHRFLIPALPALFWAVRRVLPRSGYAWAAVGAVSLLISASGVLRDLPAMPL